MKKKPGAFDAQFYRRVDPVPQGWTAPLLGLIARILFWRAARLSGVEIKEKPRAGDNVAVTTNTPQIVISDRAALYRRLGSQRLIGFGESFVAGEWNSPDLVSALTALASHMSEFTPRVFQRFRTIFAPQRPVSEEGTIEQSRINIPRHYDVSNDLFAAFLDETLTYSSALFTPQETQRNERVRGVAVTQASPPGHRGFAELAVAQKDKIDRLLDEVGVREGSRVLEIGTGWGELCVRAAQRGSLVQSVTLSGNQREVAHRRLESAGVSDRARVDLVDYRDVQGTFDCVVSVEMIEAVGYRHWKEYFSKIGELLAPGGRAGIQAITMPHERMLETVGSFTWIQKHIFPGGMLPSVEAMEESASHVGLAMTARHRFGLHYAETLRLWRERFCGRADSLPPPGDDQQFRKMWEFYLAYSEAGFRSGYLDVQQCIFERKRISA